MSKNNFKDLCSKGTCDVCGSKCEVVVVASSLGPMSKSYCESCISHGYEPYEDIIASFVLNNSNRNSLIDFYNSNELAMNSFYKKSKEDFIQDFDEAVEDYNNYGC